MPAFFTDDVIEYILLLHFYGYLAVNSSKVIHGWSTMSIIMLEAFVLMYHNNEA